MGDDRREGDAMEAPPDWFAIMGALTTLHGYAELLHRRIARGQQGRSQLMDTSARILAQADRLQALLTPAFTEWLDARSRSEDEQGS